MDYINAMKFNNKHFEANNNLLKETVLYKGLSNTSS